MRGWVFDLHCPDVRPKSPPKSLGIGIDASVSGISIAIDSWKAKKPNPDSDSDSDTDSDSDDYYCRQKSRIRMPTILVHKPKLSIMAFSVRLGRIAFAALSRSGW